MKNGKAKEYDKGASGTKAGTASSAIDQFCRVDGKAKRFGGGDQGQEKGRSDQHATDGFMRCVFQPRLKEDQSIWSSGAEHFERDFYHSLSLLASQLGLSVSDREKDNFPLNVAQSLRDLMGTTADRDSQLEGVRLMAHEGSVFFAREEIFDTGMMLYYIPVLPVYKMLKDPIHKAAAKLLLSVCSYLYRVADIPYHRQENSYLYSMYAMVLEWQLDNDEQEADDPFMCEHGQSEFVGDVIERKIQREENLVFFQQRIKNFKVRDELDRRCIDLATRFFDLYQQYPQVPVYRRMKAEENFDDQDGQFVALDQYVSFYASGSGLLCDMLLEVVNNDLQEMGAINQPVIYKPIDGRNINGNDFDFESRIFPLMEELAEILIED